MNDPRALHKLILKLQAGVATKLAAPILHTDLPHMRRKQGWQYGLVVLAAMVLLWARAPERLLSPQFYAEDGWIFFADAFNLPAWQALVRPYNGYDHLVPRLIAEISQWLPLRLAPLFFSLSALFITAVSLTWLLLPAYRSLIRHDWLRLIVVILILASPNLEGLMSIAYVQWFLAIWALLVTFVWPTHHPGWSWLLTLGYIAVSFSAPIVLILLPFWLLRCWFAPTRALRLNAWSIVVAQGLFVGRIWQQRTDPLTMLDLAEIGSSLLDLIRAVLYKILIVNLFGNQGGEWLQQVVGWPGIYLIAALLIVALLASLAWSQLLRTPAQFLFTVSLLYVIFVAAPFYWLRTYGDHDYPFLAATGSDLRAAARYFIVPSLALYLLIARMLDANWSALQTKRWRLGLGASLGMVLLLYGLTFRLPALSGGNWQQHAWLITQLRAGDPSYLLWPLEQQIQQASIPAGETQLFLPLIFKAQPSADALTLDVPIAPPGWLMRLRLVPPLAHTYDFLGGPTLLWIEPEQVEQGLLVRLHWQGNTLANARQQRYYFVGLYLIDETGTVLHSSEQPLPPFPPESIVPFVSEHLLPIAAADLDPAMHVQLRLYQLAGDERIPGPAVEVEGLFGS